jgi:hypothetical protein
VAAHAVGDHQQTQVKIHQICILVVVTPSNMGRTGGMHLDVLLLHGTSSNVQDRILLVVFSDTRQIDSE